VDEGKSPLRKPVTNDLHGFPTDSEQALRAYSGARIASLGSAMCNAINVLFVEDEDDDVVLARRALERDGIDFNWRCVVTEHDLRTALAEFRPHEPDRIAWGGSTAGGMRHGRRMGHRPEG
jgi:hypothetical protein